MNFFLDFETRSGADLREYGADVHLSHPWAGVWCVGYAIDDGPIVCVSPNEASDVLEEIANGSARIIAHNAQFEWQVWNTIMVKYGVPPVPISRFVCTMATGYAMALPGSLDGMSAALGIKQGKDLAGGRLAVQMASPRSITNGQPMWWNDAEKLERLQAYCAQDVRVEREVFTRLRPLPPEEQALWELDANINQRGIYIDAQAGAVAAEVVAVEQGVSSARLWSLTGGLVNGPSEVQKLKTWIEGQGVSLSSLAKAEVVDVLATEGLPPQVVEALEIRQAFAKTSTAKIRRMLDGRSANGRVKGTLQYHGSGTGRWAGRRVQPHNLPRPMIEQADIEAILDYLAMHDAATAAEYIKVFYGPPLVRIADCLRGLICAAPGNRLCAGDYSNIEGRALAWLAGEVWKIKAFADFDKGEGHDLYLLAASRIYKKPVETYTKKSPERQIGKVAELALGYQGGVGAFQTMAVGYGVKLPDHEADAIKVAWREAHPRIKQYWYDLEHAAVNAVGSPGVVTSTGPAYARVSFKVKGSFLWCRLPSGRALCYPYPQLKEYESPWGVKQQLSYMSVDALTHQWTRTETYGGKLAENITQATARDILAASMRTVEHAGWKIVFHVHDEIVTETKDGQLNDFLNLMRIPPPWAPGLPIAVEGWTGVRYRK